MIVVGVDGCPAGWIAVRAEWEDDGLPTTHARVFGAFEDIVSELLADGPVAVDMPIGLPDRIVGSGRGPEVALRRVLGARQSSVFSIPSRAAVHAASYGEACALALTTSTPPRKVSKQAFHLFPRIRQIDALLRADPGLAARVFETHPEGAFAAMKGGPLEHAKKTEAGLAERVALLAAVGFAPAFSRAVPRGAGADDLLDACAACWTAMRIAAGRARSFPETPGRDAHGLPIAIWI